MSTSTERRRARQEPPDLDAEREVDLRSYVSTLVLRWWLPAAGLVGGGVVGFRSSPRKIALAANALARIVIKDTSHYVATKIATFKAQVDSYSKTLSTIDKTIAQLTKATGSSGLSTSDKLVVSIELSSLTLQRSQ